MFFKQSPVSSNSSEEDFAPDTIEDDYDSEASSETDESHISRKENTHPEVLEDDDYDSDASNPGEEPLLNRTENLSSEIVEENDENKEKSFLSKEEKSFLTKLYNKISKKHSNKPSNKFPCLIEDLETGIALLKKQQDSKLNKNRFQRYLLSVACLLCIVTTFGVGAGVDVILVLLMRTWEDKLNKKNSAKLNNLEKQLDVLRNKIEYLMFKKCAKYHKKFAELHDQSDLNYEKFIVPNKNGDSCQVWQQDGKRVSIYEEFPDCDDFCWFEKTNTKHPLAYCNDILNRACQIEHEQAKTGREFLACTGEASRRIDGLREKVHMIESEINRTKLASEAHRPEKLMITSTIIIALFAVLLVVILACLWAKFCKKNLRKKAELSHYNPDLENPIHKKMVEFATKNDIGLTIDGKQIKTQDFINMLEVHLKEAKQRRLRNFVFLAGSLPQHAGTEVHDILFKNDASRDISYEILQYLKPAKKT